MYTKNGYEQLFVILKSERQRYIEEVNRDAFTKGTFLREELAKKVRQEIDFLQALSEDEDEHKNIEALFHSYTESFYNARFSGKVIIRPFNSLSEAVKDGIMGYYDTGFLAASLKKQDGYLFAIRIPEYEDKAFGYVLYDANGEIIQARQAFGLDIQNKVILNYLMLFSQDVLSSALKKDNTIKTA